MTEKLDVEETQKFVDAEIPILVFIEKGKKVYYKLVKVIDDKLLKQGLMYRFVPLTNAEMKAQGIEESTAQEVNDSSPIDIEESAAQATEPEPNLTLKGTPEAVAAAKKILLEKQAQLKAQANQPDEKDEIIDDLKNKLGIIAEKEFEKKRKAVNAPDEVNSPERLFGFEIAKKMLNPKNEPAGSAPMNPDYNPNGTTDDIYKKRFGTYDDMVKALRAESKSEDKAKAQRANLVLNALLNKYATSQRDIHTEQRFCEDDAIPKTDKVPVVDFSQANEYFSELERFGIKKSPLNYSKKPIIAQKGDN